MKNKNRTTFLTCGEMIVAILFALCIGAMIFLSGCTNRHIRPAITRIPTYTPTAYPTATANWGMTITPMPTVTTTPEATVDRPPTQAPTHTSQPTNTPTSTPTTTATATTTPTATETPTAITIPILAPTTTETRRPTPTGTATTENERICEIYGPLPMPFFGWHHKRLYMVTCHP